MKTWLITGASSGIGAALAREVLSRDEQVVAVGRNLERLVAITRDYPSTSLALAADVTDRKQVEDTFHRAAAHFSGIDVLVNNAGVVYLAAIEEGEDLRIRELFELNCFAVAACTRAVLPAMRARRTGLIVNISSSSGVVALPSLGYYAASKHALEGLTEALWQEVEPLGIKVLLVQPGGVRTGLVNRSLRSPRIAAYAATAGALRERLEAADDTAFRSDPRRAAAIICDVISNSDRLPHRLILGSDAFESISAKLTAQQAEYLQWEATSRQSDWQET
jgi:short-subunit dehydrogenase